MRSTLLRRPRTSDRFRAFTRSGNTQSPGASHTAENLPGLFVALDRQVVNRLGAELRIGACGLRQSWGAAGGNRFPRHSHHRRGRRVLLQATPIAATARMPLGLHRHVAELAAMPVMPCQMRAAQHDPAADAGAQGEHRHVCRTSRAAPSHFSPSAAALASFSRITRVPSRFSISARTG